MGDAIESKEPEEGSLYRTMELICRNLAVLGAIKDYSKLRLISYEMEDVSKISIKTHYLALEDRWLFQGLRRSQTGDGHRITISFIKHILTQMTMLADKAGNMQCERSKSMFEMSGVEILQALSSSNKMATQGLCRLRSTTYAGSEQVVVDLQNLIHESENITCQIDAYVRTLALKSKNALQRKSIPTST